MRPIKKLGVIANEDYTNHSDLFSNFSFAQEGGKSSFIIPKGYQGLILIIYNQPNYPGISVKKTERVYTIPKNGILLTKSKNDFKYAELEFYNTDSIGNIIKMEKLPGDGLYKLDTSIVKIVGGVFSFYESEQDKNPIEYMEICISNNISGKEVKCYKNNVEFRKNGGKIKHNFRF